MPYCINCGTEITEQERCCSNCGVKLLSLKSQDKSKLSYTKKNYTDPKKQLSGIKKDKARNNQSFNFRKCALYIISSGTIILALFILGNLFFNEKPSTVFANPYSNGSGTSYATPFVTGVAGLILSTAPDFSPSEVKKNIMDTAQDHIFDDFQYLLGTGVVDAYEAVTKVLDKGLPKNSYSEVADFIKSATSFWFIDYILPVFDHPNELSNDNLILALTLNGLAPFESDDYGSIIHGDDVQKAARRVFGPDIKNIEHRSVFPYDWHSDEHLYRLLGFGPGSYTETHVLSIDETETYYIVDVAHVIYYYGQCYEEEQCIPEFYVHDEFGNFIADLAEYDFSDYEEEIEVISEYLPQFPIRRYILNKEQDGTFYIMKSYLVPEVTGTHKVAYIPVKYKGSGRPSPDVTIKNLITRAGMVSHYYYQQSYGAVSIESDFIFDEWEQLPLTLREYKRDASKHEFSGEWWLLGVLVIDDAIDLAGININDYDAVVVIQPAEFKDIRPVAFFDLDTGLAIVGQKDNYGTWAHEIGHAIFKWPDFYEEKGRDNTRGTTGYWSLMGSGNWLSPPAPIMSYNKVNVNNGWLKFKDLTLSDEYPKNIKLLKDLSLGGEVYRYNTGISNPSYIILEGRKPADGINTIDPWYSGKRNLAQEEGILLYNIVQKDNAEFVFVQELYRSTDRVSLVPGESYDCDPCSTSFAALMEGTNLQIDIQPLTVTSRIIIQLSNIDYQYSSNNIAAAPNVTENQFDIDLKVYSSDGSMVGMCYDTNRYVIEIPGARSSGNVLGGGPEWISVPDDIEIYYEIDTSPMENWLDELVQIGIIELSEMEDLDLEIEVTIQEIVVDKQGERSVSEKTETLKIAYINPLESNYLSENINVYFIIITTIIIVLIIVSIIIWGIMRDRANYK